MLSSGYANKSLIAFMKVQHQMRKKEKKEEEMDENKEEELNEKENEWNSEEPSIMEIWMLNIIENWKKI